MSKTVLATVDGFTPVIDAVVQDVGPMAALAFGKVWRYCQMSDGVCKASQERMAEELKITRQTMNTHIETLVNAGYLVDTTPGLLGVPHVYADTGKANLSISFTGSCQNNIHLPVKNFDTKIVSKKEDKTLGDLERRTDATIKGDLAQAYIDFAMAPGMKKSIRMDNIASVINVRLGINPGKRWQDFMEYADQRAQKDGQLLTVFLDWLQCQPGFDVSFWPPAKLQENWPRAFQNAAAPKSAISDEENARIQFELGRPAPADQCVPNPGRRARVTA